MKKILTLLASLGMACAAFAQSYPSHPVRFVVPFPPGSLPDQIARVIGPPTATGCPRWHESCNPERQTSHLLSFAITCLR